MSRLFEALSNSEARRRSSGDIPSSLVRPSPVRPKTAVPDPPCLEAVNGLAEGAPSSGPIPSTTVLTNVGSTYGSHTDSVCPENVHEEKMLDLDKVLPEMARGLGDRLVSLVATPESRLVALTDPNSLGAEKFRALVTRLDHVREQHELKSFQVTSSVINEGKTLVAGNVALTLAKYSGSQTLLIEGDLHRPALAALFGLRELKGISQWWSGSDPELNEFVYRLEDMPLWFLPAGKPCDRPADILRSARFAKALERLWSSFDWIVVDSTPMLPIVDVNLWSRLVDGTLLVVREGVAPIKALKKGLQALDHPKLIGVVMNEASGSDQANYDGQYYSASTAKRLT